VGGIRLARPILAMNFGIDGSVFALLAIIPAAAARGMPIGKFTMSLHRMPTFSVSSKWLSWERTTYLPTSDAVWEELYLLRAGWEPSGPSGSRSSRVYARK